MAAQKRFYLLFLLIYCLASPAKSFDLNNVLRQLPAPPVVLPLPPNPATTVRPPAVESRKLPDVVSGSAHGNPKEESSASVDSAKSERPQLVPIEAFPWTAGLALRSVPASLFCGGVVISKNWLLTAAYCVAAGSINDHAILVVAGSPNSTNSKVYQVSQIVIHPDWRRESSANDIALLRISGEFTRPTLSVSFDGPPIDRQVGAIGQVVGWGITNLEVPLIQDLQLIPTRVLAKEVCASVANYATRLVDGKFCAQSLLANFDACQGFGGAGLILTDPVGRRYLGGIVSSGDGCPPFSHKPTVYSDTLRQANWIKSVIEGGAK